MDSSFTSSFVFGHPSSRYSKELTIEFVNTEKLSSKLRSSESLIFIPEGETDLVVTPQNVYIGISASAGFYPIRIFLVSNKLDSYTVRDTIKLVRSIRTGPFTWNCTPIDFHPEISARPQFSNAETQTDREYVSSHDETSSFVSNSDLSESDNESEMINFEVMIHSILSPLAIEIFELVTRRNYLDIGFAHLSHMLKQAARRSTSSEYSRRPSPPSRPLNLSDLVEKVIWIHRSYELEDLILHDTHSCTFKDCLISWMINNDTPQNNTKCLSHLLCDYILFIFNKYYRSKDGKHISIDFLQLLFDLPYSIKII